ncbi:hypothetical protein [Candidatus Viridilinea mediisalina]|uniref:Secreted protein n=1 Tax=Candidatus Viridilinea mediisalina TaxID=2024553 RepID=A0A2A6RGM3_9CHLR|nr:hypothetical protein [Candidatus Viridilinea mediisalina]PDW02010.1 hypothetical protein CJ255_16200 [Candidatus Viridilinea mediisalina]
MMKRTPTCRTAGHDLKTMINVAAVAATLGGWALLAHASPATTTPEALPTTSGLFAPIPTLVPLVQFESQVAPQLVNPTPPVVRPTAVTVTRSSR